MPAVVHAAMKLVPASSALKPSYYKENVWPGTTVCVSPARIRSDKFQMHAQKESLVFYTPSKAIIQNM